MPEIRGGFHSFPEAVQFFRRKVNVPSAQWDDLLHAEHASGFMVAGVTRMAVLDDIRTAVDAAIADGETLEDFRKRFRQIVAKHGWPGGAGGDSEAGFNWRTKVIYHTNLRTAYMAGRWEKLKTFPYLRYQHNTQKNPREDHKAWDGKIIPTNDPWWQTHYPPNGWGCRCSVTGVSEARFRTLGGRPDAAPGTGAGEPPPEWAYHVGTGARSMAAAESFGQKVMTLPEAWRTAVLEDAQRRQVDWMQDWQQLVDSLNHQIQSNSLRATGSAQPVGFLTSGETAGLAQEGVAVSNALIVAGDDTIIHVLRSSKLGEREELRALFVEQAKAIPRWRSEGQFVSLLDMTQRHPKLLVVRKLADGRYMRMVIALDDARKYNRSRLIVNAVDTVELSTLDALRRLPVIDGSWE